MLVFDVSYDGVPTMACKQTTMQLTSAFVTYHLSLLTWSPYPGVSTILSRRRTPFSSITADYSASLEPLPRAVHHIPCETPCISVVVRTGSFGVRRPFESMRCDAKMVFIRVDLPKPVCPIRLSDACRQRTRITTYQHRSH